MKQELQALTSRLENTLSGDPWYGRSVYSILDEVDAKKAIVQLGGSSHSMLEILYHMNTWSSFTYYRIIKDKKNDFEKAELEDWAKIDLKKQSWIKTLAEQKAINKNIIQELNKKDDDFLLEIVDYRKYNFRFLINGLIEHTIYHAGQIALMNKLPDA